MIYLIIKLPIPDDLIMESNNSSLKKKIIYLGSLLLLLTIFPIWIIRGANPDWRLINFALFAVTLLNTSYIIYDKGGLKMIKLYSFPLLFFLVSIPWPLAKDLQLTQWLQQKVSSSIVDLLLLMEHEATLEGTIIDVGVFGQIGVTRHVAGSMDYRLH